MDPRAMSTSLTSGPKDPSPVTTNVKGVKRIRKKVQLAAGIGQMTIGDIITCLPLTTPEIRIMKFSVWASATSPSLLSVVFPVSNVTGFGDNAAWNDEGTQGQQRPAIHLIPNFNFRSFWFTPAFSSNVIATFGGTATDLLVVDITVEYRTAVQSCPAMVYLQTLMHDSDLFDTHDEVDGTPPVEEDTSPPADTGTSGYPDNDKTNR